MNNILGFKDYMAQLNESDPNTRIRNGQYAELYPQAYRMGAQGQGPVSPENLPSWKDVLKKDKSSIVEIPGDFPDDVTGKKVKDGGVELTHVPSGFDEPKKKADKKN
jgi:hypothetical protein